MHFFSSFKRRRPASPPESEESEIRRAQKDPEAFGVLYERYFDAIFLFVYRRVENEDLCADITQQTFIKAMTHLKSYEHRGHPFSAWLYRIALNEVNQFHRTHQRSPRIVSLETPAAREVVQEIGLNTDEQQAMAWLESVLRHLDDASLWLLEMRFFEQKSFREMGDILGISEANAKVKTYRVLQQLKTKFPQS